MQSSQTQATDSNTLQLKSLSSHLDLLTAGSLFLLPSILPYLASGLSAYTSSSSLSSSNDWNWGTAWIMILPCIGLVIPMTAALIGIQTSPSAAGSQPRKSRCPWARWSSNTRVSSWRTCPTIQSLQRSWWAVRGRPSGYGPLTQDPLSPSSPKLSRPCSPLGGGPCAHHTNNNNNNNNNNNTAMLKRPRVVLLSSLCFWTLLMILSSVGLNKIRPMSSLTQNNASLQITSPSPSDEVTAPYGEIDLRVWEPSSTIVIEVDPLPVVYPEGFTMAEDVEDDAEVVPEFFEMVVVAPLEEFLEMTESMESMTMAIELEGRRASPPPPPAWVKRDFEEEEAQTDEMDAMTLDPEDATVFHDFLLSLETEDEARRAFEDNSEGEEDRQRKVLQATEDLIVDSIFENKMPCRNTGRGLFVPLSSTDGQVFEYRAGWTDLMIVAIAMSLGGVLVGLAQARVLAKELQRVANPCRPGYMSIATCVLLSGSALGLTVLMIVAECWDTPSLYFTGIGVAGIILVQAWVPDHAIGSACLPLVMSGLDDFVNVSCLNNSDDDDVEETFVGEKFQVQVVANNELLTVAERRNACSLDESRRLEVISCCRTDSC
ncbi:hypothetical protein CPB97_009529 [Podila verticillata]|nr:hypothetical protein CPB97_009529 [Podila verticillata]